MARGTLWRLFAVGVLLFGLGCAVSVYLVAPGDAVDGAGYVAEGGEVYSVRPEDSRSYLRNLEYIGGKSAVFMVELRGWFAGVWSGGAFAVLIALAAASASIVCLRAADRADRQAQSNSAPHPDE
ncbi:hypothetical protein [Humidesulfovibrio idahonensis]